MADGKMQKDRPFSKYYGKSKAGDFALSVLIACGVVLFYLAVTSFVAFSFDAALSATSGGGENEANSLTLKNAGMISLIGNTVALSLGVLFIYILNGNAKTSLQIKVVGARCALASVILGGAMNLFADAATRVLPFSENMLNSYNETYSFLGEGNAFVEFVAIAIAAPIVEETFFRGAVYGTLKRGMPKAAAVLISAAMFGAAHGSFISFIFTFILGVILALALDATRSIYVPMMIHISFNASSYLITLALDGATGAETLIICIGGALLGASALSSLFVLGKTKKTPAPDGTENGDTVK